MLIPDDETAIDFLNYEAISRTVVKLLKDNQQGPLTIGIHGGWGAGKSSILKMIESEIERGDNGIVCLWFNGWTFQGFDDAKIILMKSTINELCRKRSKVGNVKKLGAELSSRVDWLKLSLWGSGIALALTQFLSSSEHVASIASILNIAKSNVQSLDSDDIETGIEKVTSFLKPRESNDNDVVEHIHQFRKDFENLLTEAGVKQLVILIDDLDRCLPSTAIDTLEAIRLFLFVPCTAFVIGADEAMIEYSVRQHFPELPVASDPMPYARNYLEKLIQVPFRIPSLGIQETITYVTLLLIRSLVGEEGHQGFQALLDTAKEGLSKPWLEQGIQLAEVKEVDPARETDLVEAYILAQRIGPILAEGTKGNPRQIKRFLNSMLTRHAIADAKGFGDEISQTVLAKLMLAELFQPDFYEFLAEKAVVSDQEGIAELMLLEEKSTEERDAEEETVKGKEEGDDSSSNSDTLKWLNREWLKRWLQIEPQLGETDLRPYIFVARDKRILAGKPDLGSLEQLITTLCGSALAIRGVESQVKDLTESESAQVFEKLKEIILRKGDFSTEPEGFHGMSIVAKHHPRFQSEMLSLLGGLDTNELGVWVIAGWTEVLTDPAAMETLNVMLSQWAGQDDNSMLRAAATQALRSRHDGAA